MVARGQQAHRFARAELATARRVFPEGHHLHKKKIGERLALERYILDILTLLHNAMALDPAFDDYTTGMSTSPYFTQPDPWSSNPQSDLDPAFAIPVPPPLNFAAHLHKHKKKAEPKP
jgi:hypothetical protein